MKLGPGSRIGSYEILTLLGSGSMGEVYRARDPRLKREIAIKVLPETTADDPDRRARLQREAQSIAALSHPNIVTIYSVEDIQGVLCLTMEYVDGTPLSHLIVKGGLPVPRILALAIPLADAISAAHQKGIAHRDLKPANVMIGADGRVKVLDFGLAKLLDAPSVEMGVTGLPTVTLTGEGRIVGTVAYMSPEQAEGKPLDHRSDIFSLGVMLYEVATGVRPFTGDTSVSVISSIIKDTPVSVTNLRPNLPHELSRIVKRCLVKDPDHRYQTAKDLRNELDDLKHDLESGELASAGNSSDCKPLKPGATRSFGAQLKALREAAGFTQEELATIAGLSVHAVSALERGHRRRPHVDTVRALSAALDLTGATREAFIESARAPAHNAAVDQLRDDVSLPQAPTVLLGRDVDLQTLQLWLADPTARLITLTGPGGAGKTRLALELARAKTAEGVRVIFVGLAAVRNDAFVASAIAEALGVVDATAINLATRLQAVCAETPTVLVLDNFEQVLGAAPLVADLLASVAALRVLITSRAPLRVRGEREYAVGPLAMDVDAGTTSPADLARSPAVRLFLERVRDVQPDFRLTSANGPAVAEICRRLDALPLALELAAPWLKVLTPEDLCRRLARDVLISTAGPRDLPERQQTMNATVAWSYQLLNPNEQRMFRRLGALPRRFPIEAAAAVVAGRDGTPVTTDKALDLAASLIDKSLLLRAESSVATRPLYEMLETVRAYAAVELTAAGERDDAMERLVRYCAAEASMAAEGLIGPAQGEWLDRVRDDLESYRSGLTWLIERKRPVEASDIAWSLFFFWGIRGHATEGVRWYDQILDQPSLPAAVECRALLGTAAMRFTQGELGHALTALTRSLALAYESGNMVMIARAENLMGDIEHSLGNADAALEHFARGVEGFRALALPWGLGNSLTGMAAVVLATGDPARAERLLEEATSVLRHAAPWFLSWTLYLRAFVAVQRGNPQEAIALVRECLTYIRELRDRFAFVYAMVPLAAAAVLRGDDVWAARILGAADSASERTGATVSDRAVQNLREQAEREARARLGPDRWARSYAAGRVASIDSLIQYTSPTPPASNGTVTSARSLRPGSSVKLKSSRP